MKKIKITALETGHLSSKALSGGDILFEKMYPYLAKKIKLAVIVPKVSAHHWRTHNDVTIYSLPKNWFDSSINKVFIFFSYLVRSIQSYKILKRTKFDLIYSSTNVLPDIIPAYFFKIAQPDKYWIARVHHLISSPARRPGNFLANLIAFTIQTLLLKITSKADLIIVLNSRLVRELESLGISSSKIQVLGAGIDLKKIKAVKTGQKLYDGIFVGRLHQSKGVYDLVKIWKKVTSFLPEAKLAIVGEARPQVSKGLTEIIKLESLTSNIFILGYLPENRLYQVLKQSRVFLFTDYEAGFGIAVAEAMATGLPVVGWDIGILGGVFKVGFLKVPLNDIEGFARKIINILTNKNLFQRLSKDAQKEAVKLDWEKISQKFNSVLINYSSIDQKK